MAKAFQLISLVRQEGLDERFPEDPDHLGVLLQGMQGGLKITGKFLRLTRVVPVALQPFRWSQLVTDSEIRGSEQSAIAR
jgi:hypothetical protein